MKRLVVLLLLLAPLAYGQTMKFTSEVHKFTVAFPNAEMTYSQANDATQTVGYTAWSSGHTYGAMVGIETESAADSALSDNDFFALAQKNFATGDTTLNGCVRQSFSGYAAERCEVDMGRTAGTILFIRKERNLLYGIMGLQVKGNGEDANIAAFLASFKFTD